MARRTDEFELAWSSLSGGDTTEGWRTIEVSTAPSYFARVGRRFPGNEESFLLGMRGGITVSEKLPEGQGFEVERVDLHGDGQMWLALSRRPSGSQELFAAMVTDVADAIEAVAHEQRDRIIGVFVRRVAAWQEFMRKGAQLLTPEQEIGLVGELAVARAMVKAGANPVLVAESWVGPLDGLQDFNIESGAVEVKTTLASAGFPARIGSLEQLDDSVRQPIFVAAVRLRQIAGGQDLPSFVIETAKSFAGSVTALEIYSERVLAAGYLPAHAARYTRTFEVADVRVVEVGAGFPRLTQGTVPVGVTRAIYDIDLSAAPGQAIELAAALKELGAV